MTIAQLLRWSLRRHAARVAVRFNGGSLTYSELDERSRRLAGHLQSRGLLRGDRVATLLLNCPAHVDVQLATARAGLVTVPIGAYFDPAPAEVAFQLNLVGASALIYSAQLEPLIAALRSQAPSVHTWLRSDGVGETYEAALAGSDRDFADIDTAAVDNYCIRFTGGTTGRPKAVLHTHAGYAAMVVNQLLALDVRATDVMAMVHPLSHACGQLLYPYLVKGATTVIEERFQAERLLRSISLEGVTSVFLVPTAVASLLEATPNDGSRRHRLRTVFYGGAPMSPALLRRGLAKFGRVFVQVYGQSESPQAVVVLEKADHRLSGPAAVTRRLAAAGRPVAGVEILVADEAGREVEAGNVGEICIRGPQLMAGYWGDEAATKARIRHGWLLTGDMAWRDHEGYLFLVDRKDDMIVSGGMNVYPREVEDRLSEHPAVAEVAVVGVPDERWGEAVRAVVVLRNGANADERDLLDHCRPRMARYKVPKSIVFEPGPLPKSAVGKLLRREIRAPYWRDSVRQVN
jgi:acyl-CoA synthetase (AMP-forming)/AMP-acid ligase II